jgi:hypothetical protein
MNQFKKVVDTFSKFSANMGDNYQWRIQIFFLGGVIKNVTFNFFFNFVCFYYNQ